MNHILKIVLNHRASYTLNFLIIKVKGKILAPPCFLIGDNYNIENTIELYNAVLNKKLHSDVFSD